MAATNLPITPADPALAALTWLVDAATGTIATSVAILSIAVLGLLMLRGQIEWRRSAMTIIGIFVIIGAHAIALGLYGVSGAEDQLAALPLSTTSQDSSPPKPEPPHVFDPYAGAAVPIR